MAEIETAERRVLSWLHVQRINAAGQIAESWQLATDGVDWG